MLFFSRESLISCPLQGRHRLHALCMVYVRGSGMCTFHVYSGVGVQILARIEAGKEATEKTIFLNVSEFTCTLSMLSDQYVGHSVH